MQSKEINRQSESHEIHSVNGQNVFQYANCFGNSICIATDDIEFNGAHFQNDRKSKTYANYFTSDGLYAIILVEAPHAIQILNLKSGEILVAQGLEDLRNIKILAASLKQPKPNTNSKNPKINLIYEHKMSLYLRIIQIEGKVDREPKERTKLIEQNLSSNVRRTKPIFCIEAENQFIVIKKEIKVWYTTTIQNELQLKEETQRLERSLQGLIERNTILGMIESLQTWSLLCVNNNSKTDESIFLNIFWQHRSKQMTNLYYNDKAFIKSVSLPCTEKEFVKFWFYSGFYFVETRKSLDRGHFCFIISEKIETDSFFMLKLQEQSEISSFSFEANNEEISLIEISREKKVYKTKIVFNRDSSFLTQTASTNNTASSTPSVSNKVINPQPKETQTNIKQFFPSTENKDNTTTKKNEPIAIEQTKALINEKIVHHLSKIDEQRQEESSVGEEDVPDKLQSLISFGAPSEIKKEINKVEHKAEISFGAPQTLLSNTKTETKPDTKEVTLIKKEKNTVDSLKASTIRAWFQKIHSSFRSELEQRENEIKENFSMEEISKPITLDPMFTKEVFDYLVHIEKQLYMFELKQKGLTAKRKSQEKSVEKEEEKLEDILKECYTIFDRLQITKESQNSAIQSLRKLTKSCPPKRDFAFLLSRTLEELNQEVLGIHEEMKAKAEKIGKDLLIAKKKKFKGKLNEIYYILNKVPVKAVGNVTKIPIPERITIYRSKPIINLNPL